MEEAEAFLANLSSEVQRRLQEAGQRGRRVTLKVMVRKAGAPVESAKYGGHGVCDHLAQVRGGNNRVTPKLPSVHPI